MKKVLATAILLVLALTLAACGSGAPSWIMNPSSNRNELIARFREEGWEVHTNIELGQTFVMATFTNYDLEALEDDAVVTIYFATVIYFDTEGQARAWEILIREEMVTGLAEIPTGVSVRYEIGTNGNIGSSWSRMRGPIRDLG